MAKNPRKKEGVSIESYDNANYKATDAYAAIIQRLFDRTTEIIARAAARGTIDPDKPFSFADYPQLRTIMEDATNELANNMQGVIAKGTRKQWEYAGKKCDAFLASIIDTSKLSKKQLEQMRLRSLSALSAFQERKVGGMNLSQRVWKYVDQYKQQLEEALDVGLGEGRSAAQLARDVRQNLVEPNRLFRRVRDKRGNLQLSRNAAAYHPGQGVYRSSVKNAQRLTRSEINMAYRESDWQRWQSLDFVVGFEVVRSNHEPEYHCDLCDRLAGRYPKTFKFLGWHPQCRCHAVPIMADYFSKDASNDRIARMRAALYGTEYKKYVPKETITDLPDGFKAYRKEMIAKQKALPKGKKLWKEPPYFIRDNFEDGDITKDFIRSAQAKTVDQVEPMKMALSALPKEQQNAIRNRINNLELGEELEDACYRYKISTQHWVDMAARAYDDPENNWQLVDECDAEKKRLESECDRRAATDKQTASDMIAKLESAIPACEPWDGNAATRAKTMLGRYRDYFNEAVAERWGNYIPIIGASCQNQIDTMLKAITAAKDDLQNAHNEGNAIINAATDKTKTTALTALLNETPRDGRDALTLAKEIRDEIKRTSAALGMGDPNAVDDVLKTLKAESITTNDVQPLAKSLSETDIIARVGGGDQTGGSCASAALAYAANKCGLDVLDFRGGRSTQIFSRSGTIDAITKLLGGTVIKKGNDFTAAKELMDSMVEGHQYYFGVGQHVAIVRKTATGYEYLELQSSTNNGFHELTKERLKNRFGCKTRHSRYGKAYEITAELIDITKFTSSSDQLKKVLAYMNTSNSDQKKGASGTPK